LVQSAQPQFSDGARENQNQGNDGERRHEIRLRSGRLDTGPYGNNAGGRNRLLLASAGNVIRIRLFCLGGKEFADMIQFIS
jgi:hypothetical protein